jgi:hypothetical protein
MNAAADRPTSFGALALPVVVGVLFSQAMAIGKAVHNVFSTPDPRYATETGFIAMVAGFLAVAAVSAYLTRIGRADAEGVLKASLGAVIGSAVAAVTATLDPAGAPTAAAVKPLFFVFVAAILFVLPLVALPSTANRWSDAVGYCGRLAVAALAAGVVTALLQGLPLLVAAGAGPPGPHLPGPDDKTFLIVRPIATGLLMAPWILAAYDPLLRPAGWRDAPGYRRTWIAAHLLMAASLAAIYALLIYRPDHAGQHGWFTETRVSGGQLVLLFWLILLAPLAAAGAAIALRSGLAVAGLLALAGPALAAWLLAARADMPAAHALLFAGAHAASSLAVTGIALAIGRRGWSTAVPAPAGGVGLSEAGPAS